MELDRRLLVAHCAAHTLSVVAGLMVVVPLALNGSAFKGRCALFTTGSWRTENVTDVTGEPGEISHLVVQQWGPPAACQFATFVGVFTVLYGAAQGWRSIFYLHGRHDETAFQGELDSYLLAPESDSEMNALEWWKISERNFPRVSHLAKRNLCIPAISSPSERIFSTAGNTVTCHSTLFSAFLTLILSLCVLFLSGGASATLSLGLISWCHTVTDDNTRPYSCAESQSIPMYLDVETSSFYTELTLAEVALWSVTALWLTHSILSFMRLYHSHSQHISGPCLPREKEHLLGHSTSSSSSSDRGSPSPLLAQSTAPCVIFI